MRRQIQPATPYSFGQLGSFGKANLMLIKQHKFPKEYEDQLDKLESADHDRYFQWDYMYSDKCFKKHIGGGELGFENWLNKSSDQKVIDFLIEFMKVDIHTFWSGYRIRGTVSGTGHAVWSLELFAKDPRSETIVYQEA